MATSLKQAFSGGGGIISLSPDITGSGQGSIVLSPNGTAQTILSLTGKYAVSLLSLETGTEDPCSIEMVVDGETIFDTTVTAPSNVQDGFCIYGGEGFSIFDGTAVGNYRDSIPFLVENSLQIKISRATAATPVTLRYITRPIK